MFISLTLPVLGPINKGVEEFFPHPSLSCFKVSSALSLCCELSLLINLEEGLEIQLQLVWGNSLHKKLWDHLGEEGESRLEVDKNMLLLFCVKF